MRKSRLASRCLKRIQDQEEWIKDHGGTLSGYIERYGDPGLEYCSGDGGTAIYNADITELRKWQTMYDEVQEEAGPADETESVL